MTTLVQAHPCCPRSRSWLTCLALALVCVGLGPVAGARAGEWAQVTCSNGTEPAPTEGWAYGSLGGYPTGTFGATDTCQKASGSLRLHDEAVDDRTPESGPMWVYSAPGGSTIAGGTVALSMVSPGGQAYLATPANETTVENLLVMCTEICTTPHTSTVSIFHTGGTQLFAVTQCTPPSGQSLCSEGGVNAEINITAATILLASQAKPTGTEFAGSLLNNPTGGKASLTFTAHDENGPGVYNASVAIDGQTVWHGTPNTNEGKCASHGTYEGALEFLYAQPCPRETGAHVEIDTTVLAEGQHALTVEVEDAAGNKATVYTGTITIDNHPPPITPPARGAPNGDPVSDQAILTLSQKEPRSFNRSLARSAITLSGRLTTPTGTSISNARVQLLEQIAGSSTVAPVASTITSSTGAWRLRAPRGPSRLLRVAYYSHSLDTVPAGAVDVREKVPAVVSMHAPRRVRIGHAVVFSGQLAGGYMPTGGESVQMEILYAGRWRTIEVLPTNSRGRWAYKYVFTLGAGATYLFRAVTVPNGVYPFASAASKPVRVTVRP